jgi:hypothetical protein
LHFFDSLHFFVSSHFFVSLHFFVSPHFFVSLHFFDPPHFFVLLPTLIAFFPEISLRHGVSTLRFCAKRRRS